MLALAFFFTGIFSPFPLVFCCAAVNVHADVQGCKQSHPKRGNKQCGKSTDICGPSNAKLTDIATIHRGSRQEPVTLSEQPVRLLSDRDGLFGWFGMATSQIPHFAQNRTNELLTLATTLPTWRISIIQSFQNIFTIRFITARQALLVGHPDTTPM
jgi:hypothetical protein